MNRTALSAFGPSAMIAGRLQPNNLFVKLIGIVTAGESCTRDSAVRARRMSLKLSRPVLSTTTEIGSVICSSYLLFRPLPGGGLKITDRVPGDCGGTSQAHKADVTRARCATGRLTSGAARQWFRNLRLLILAIVTTHIPRTRPRVKSFVSRNKPHALTRECG